MTDPASPHDRMGDFLDGSLAGSDLLQFEKQLKSDEAFRRSFAGYCATVDAVACLPKAKLSEFGRARLRRAVVAAQRSWWSGGLARPAGYATAAALLLTIGFVSGREYRTQAAGVFQALPAPSPTLRLRDAQTGGWLDVQDFAEHVKRSRQNYAVVPQVRVPMNVAAARLTEAEREVQSALERRQVHAQTVQFFAPVEVKENLLDGPEVEFWIQPVSVALPGNAR